MINETGTKILAQAGYEYLVIHKGKFGFYCSDKNIKLQLSTPVWPTVGEVIRDVLERGKRPYYRVAENDLAIKCPCCRRGNAIIEMASQVNHLDGEDDFVELDPPIVLYGDVCKFCGYVHTFRAEVS